MKKFILTALTALTLVSGAFATSGNKVNNRVKTSFHNDFSKVEDVEWKSTNTYVVASFVADEKAMQAFYDYNGSLIGTSHAVSIDNLPARSKRTIAKKYGSYTIKEAIKFESSDETAYYVSAENESESLVLKVSDAGVSIFKKVK